MPKPPTRPSALAEAPIQLRDGVVAQLNPTIWTDDGCWRIDPELGIVTGLLNFILIWVYAPSAPEWKPPAGGSLPNS